MAQLRHANCHIELDVVPKPLPDSYPGGIEQVPVNLINDVLPDAPEWR